MKKYKKINFKMEDSINKLKPCPKCHSYDLKTHKTKGGRFSIKCKRKTCRIQTPKFNTEKEARDCWNDREITSEYTWSLDNSFAQWIAPRLKLFKTICIGHPSQLKSMDEWYEILDKMIDTFESISNGAQFEFNDEMQKELDIGLDLFREYYFDLWD